MAEQPQRRIMGVTQVPESEDPKGRADTEAAAAGGAQEDLALRVTRDHGGVLLDVAVQVIAQGLRRGRPPAPVLEALPPALAEPGAAFVTLSRRADGGLRGCIGSLMAHQPLARDIAVNAWAAATRDPRFPQVRAEDLPGLALSVSVLTAPRPLAFRDQEDLIARMRPGVDGLILSDKGRRGVFLPQVWESLPEPAVFLSHLKRKAGLPETHWSDSLTVDRFEAHAVKAEAPWAGGGDAAETDTEGDGGGDGG